MHRVGVIGDWRGAACLSRVNCAFVLFHVEVWIGQAGVHLVFPHFAYRASRGMVSEVPARFGLSGGRSDTICF